MRRSAPVVQYLAKSLFNLVGSCCSLDFKDI